MKKSLVVLMAVVMTFAFAAATVAADLSYWAGGDMYFYFDSNERGLIESQGTFMVDGGNPMVKVTNGNTYAQAWYNTDKWRTPTTQWRFAFGWNKIGDVLDLGFSTKDTGTANIGQVAFTDSFNNFHGDPLFCSYDNPYAIFAVLTLGNVTIKSEYNVAPEKYSHTGWDAYGGNTSTSFANAHDNSFLSVVFKLDSGDIHFGYKNGSNIDESYMGMIGGAFNIGDASLKVDLWKQGEGAYPKEWGGPGSSVNYANDGDDIGAPGTASLGLQANFAINKFDATLFFVNPNEDNLENEIGIGANYKFDKLTIGAKYFKNYQGSEVLSDNAYEIFGIYNVGAFDVKFGVLDRGEHTETASGVTTLYDNDLSLIVGFHAGLW